MVSRPGDQKSDSYRADASPIGQEAKHLLRGYRRAQEQVYATATVRRFARLVLWGWVAITPLALAEKSRVLLPIHLGGLLYGRLMVRSLDAEHTARSEARLRNLFVAMGMGLGCVMSFEALLSGGLRSIFLYPQLLALTGTAVVNIPWRKLAPRSLPVFLSPWVVTICGLLVIPALRPQLADPALLRHAGAILLTQAAALACFVFVADGHHRLRGQLYESRSLGRYKLQNKLGAGGMGEVWRAYDTALKRDVALKISKPSGHATSWARFEREVGALAKLTHPHAVKVYDYAVTADGLRYYAMELLEGRTLAALVQVEGPLPWARAARLAASAAAALGEAHASGVVHRDIKPQNLFVAEAGGERDFIKVIDFGVAQIQDPEHPALTTTGVALGTPAYMAPEIIMGKPAAPTADVYALGATLYFALTGEPPYPAETRLETLLAHVRARPNAPSAHPRACDVPAAIDDIVLRCMAKNPSDRFADATDLSAALAAVLGGAKSSTAG